MKKQNFYLAAAAAAITLAIIMIANFMGILHPHEKFRNSIAVVKHSKNITICIDGNLSVLDRSTDKIIKKGGRCEVQILELH